MLEGIFASIFGDTITEAALLTSAAVSLALGMVISWTHRRASGAGASMGSALIVLPFLVQIVILLVNGNLGAGVAVAGAFSLVRFRSAPGSARDIVIIFLAMAVGLACGMGYIGIAVLSAAVVCLLNVILGALRPAELENRRELKITIPEDLDYTGLFDDLMCQYTRESALMQVKTANMGSLYSLIYEIRLKSSDKEKEFIDQLRCRNGNLDIVCGRVPNAKETL